MQCMMQKATSGCRSLHRSLSRPFLSVHAPAHEASAESRRHQGMRGCAVHELTAEHTDVMLDFFEKNAALDESPMHVAHPFVAVEARVVGERADLDMPIPKYHHHSHAHALGEWFAGLRASGGPGGR